MLFINLLCHDACPKQSYEINLKIKKKKIGRGDLKKAVGLIKVSKFPTPQKFSDNLL